MKKIITVLFVLTICIIFPPKAPADLNEGLIGYWPFSGDADDESSNDNDGIVHQATLTEDRFGSPNRAYSFNITDDHIKLSRVVNIPSITDATLSFWAAHEEKCNDEHCTMYSESAAGTNADTYFCVQYSRSNSKLALHAVTVGIYVETSYTIPFDGSWHHYVVTKVGNVYKVYVDTNNVGLIDEQFPVNAEVTYIGERTPPVNYQPIIGKMDDIRIYKRAISEAEIRLLYMEGIYVTCNGEQVTIIGTEGNDIIIGTDGPDVIHGLGGVDIIRGMGGDDIICGGDAADFLSGVDGNDIILGEHGDDAIWGGPGNDIIDGGDGHDSIKGGYGNDELNGGDGHDVLDGLAGDDILKGNYGNDTLYGGSGVDQLYGGSGPDNGAIDNNDTCYDTAGTVKSGCEVFYVE